MRKESRSRVTNGNGLFFDRPNGRTPEGRRFRDVMEAFVEELGGPDKASVTQLSLARRATGMSVQLEKMESDFAGGEPVDLNVYATTTNSLLRVLTRLGLVAPMVDDSDDLDLDEYLAKKVKGN